MLTWVAVCWAEEDSSVETADSCSEAEASRSELACTWLTVPAIAAAVWLRVRAIWPTSSVLSTWTRTVRSPAPTFSRATAQRDRGRTIRRVMPVERIKPIRVPAASMTMTHHLVFW
ncbi:hypothetical protein Ari01nite_90700 [Paractinoplanes rishiriensis]|uniref:Uncharacterized protein n=1 Tax=Paractinoplanes rishiriensis TaxID=1050105 RepID=A0A919KA04_9ACTN|nr:hypothetical protein Ari01nite_90700 [Actinoplanes rishiriensis]